MHINEAIAQFNIGENSVFYVNAKKAAGLLERAGLQLPGGPSYDGFVGSIHESAFPVKAEADKMNHTLQKPNAELKDTVEYLRELVCLHGKVTDGTVYIWGSVEAAAR